MGDLRQNVYTHETSLAPTFRSTIAQEVAGFISVPIVADTKDASESAFGPQLRTPLFTPITSSLLMKQRSFEMRLSVMSSVPNRQQNNDLARFLDGTNPELAEREG